MVKEFYIDNHRRRRLRGKKQSNQQKGKLRNAWWAKGSILPEVDWKVGTGIAQLKCNWFVTEDYSWEDSILTPSL